MSPRSSKGECVRILRILGTLAGVCCLGLLAACGGSSTATPTITLVGASCNPTSIASLGTSQCTASVSGTGSFSSTVLWAASSGGTINATSGLFTAATVPFSTQVTITATSTQDTTKTGSTTITVATAGTVSSVTATCTPTSVQTGQLSTCSAVVNGTGNFSPNVTWSANGGTINAISGLFNSASAGTFTITATSQQDSTKAGTATWNQWKHLLGTKIEVEGAFVQSGKYRKRREQWELVNWETALPSRLEVTLPPDFQQQLESAKTAYHRFRQYSRALDQIRLCLQHRAVERAELQRMCSELRIPGDFEDIGRASSRETVYSS